MNTNNDNERDRDLEYESRRDYEQERTEVPDSLEDWLAAETREIGLQMRRLPEYLSRLQM